MNFEYEVSMNVPAEYAYERFTNMQEISSTLPANIVLRSEDSGQDLKVGSKWVVKAQRSGRNFVIRNKVVKNDPPTHLAFESESNRMESMVNIIFEETGSESCKIKALFEIEAKGLLGRILLQSIKASKGRILSAMDSGANRLSETIEEDYQATQT